MKCLRCDLPAVINLPQYCKEHYCAWFESVVKQTIDDNKLIPNLSAYQTSNSSHQTNISIKKLISNLSTYQVNNVHQTNISIKKLIPRQKQVQVGVAVSGGKDSMTLLHILKKTNYDVFALSVDEGISGYRDKTLEIVKTFCGQNQIPLQIKSFKDSYGKSLDKATKHYEGIPCRLCGAWRRSLLNELAFGCDVIATGHNLDDEAQSVFMNMMHNQSSLNARIGPRVGVAVKNPTKMSTPKKAVGTKEAAKQFVQRIKPLFWLSEKQIKAYAFLQNIPLDAAECPNAFLSFRAKVRDMLNRAELHNPMIKINLLRHALLEQTAPIELKSCRGCGLPCSATICRSCVAKQEVFV